MKKFNSFENLAGIKNILEEKEKKDSKLENSLEPTFDYSDLDNDYIETIEESVVSNIIESDKKKL